MRKGKVTIAWKGGSDWGSLVAALAPLTPSALVETQGSPGACLSSSGPGREACSDQADTKPAQSLLYLAEQRLPSFQLPLTHQPQAWVCHLQGMCMGGIVPKGPRRVTQEPPHPKDLISHCFQDWRSDRVPKD